MSPAEAAVLANLERHNLYVERIGASSVRGIHRGVTNYHLHLFVGDHPEAVDGVIEIDVRDGVDAYTDEGLSDNYPTVA